MINDLEISTDIASTEQMDDSELQGIITSDLEDAVSYIDSDLSPIRAKGTLPGGGDGGARHCERHDAQPHARVFQHRECR